MNLLQGTVNVEITGLDPERFLNLCAQSGVRFWGLERLGDGILRLTVAWSHRKRLEEPARRAGCVVEELEREGLPAFLLRFRRRYALLLGLTLTLAAVIGCSQFILVVDVEGNETVPTAVILSQLHHEGLRPGAYGPSLSVRDIANAALLELPDLSWMAVNLHGIRAQVLVRERVERPELTDRKVHGDIVAKAAGIVSSIDAWSGDRAVQPGATVLPGDVLIRGSLKLDPPQYSEREPIYVPVRAMGKVEGHTWRTLWASIPLTAEVKTAEDDEKALWSLSILGQRVNFYQNSGFLPGKYDKIIKTWNLTLPGGLVLPLTLRQEKLTAYETAPAQVDQEAAQSMLEERLAARLAALMGEKGEVINRHFSAGVNDGMLLVTLTAECREELGRFIPTQ